MKTSGILAVCMGLLMENEEHRNQLKESFEELGFVAPEIILTFKTLPTPGILETGGRSDVLVSFNNKDVSRLAIHPLHIGPNRLFSWADDYLENNKDIIPEDVYEIIQEKLNHE